MKNIQLKDSTAIVLRPMDKSFIIPGGYGRCPANCDIRLDGKLTPSDQFRLLSEKLIEHYGTSAILAWDGDLLIGFVSFYPLWCFSFDMCDDEQINEALKHLDDIENRPSNSYPALNVNCLIVKEHYRGNNLAVQLLEYLKEWAKAHDWKLLIAHGCIFSGNAQYQWLISPKPPKYIWGKAGFIASNYSNLLKAESSFESTKRNREWYRTFDLPAYVPRDVNPDDDNWIEIFKDYTMICKL
jgi:GNAT superfamily N-acetyltransferase